MVIMRNHKVNTFSGKLSQCENLNNILYMKELKQVALDSQFYFDHKDKGSMFDLVD